ncbi:MAG: aminotransferase class V-fold PLP-dependent enzyme [Anaerolineales bacterium]|nr:aminotransferase class V-fold PLP-dependent enzyme [Anaerolineales bacterium]
MSIWNSLENEIKRFRQDSRTLPVMPQVSPEQLRKELEGRYTFEQPVALEEVTADAICLLRDYTVHVTHPRYFGLFNPSVRYASIVADVLTALYNPQLAAWSHAPAANEIERLTLRHFTRSLGWNPDTTIMNFTSGGMEANLSAVLAALAHHFPETGKEGLASLTLHPAIYITAESHHSFIKIARMTGLGTDCLHEVPTTKDHLMDTDALVELITRHKDFGYYPLMVVGTAGTTGAGLIDPLGQIAEIAEQYDIWFHVDAAWGGSALLSPRLRPLWAGVEGADSVTWDAHKWLSVPMGAGMFFCRHIGAVTNAFAVTTSYMPGKTGEGTFDPYATTAQWSRRMIGLKVFMALAESGSGGYADIIEHQAREGDYLREQLKKAGWVVVNNTQLPVVCFSHADIRSGKMTTKQILGTIYARNRVWISDVLLGGEELVLRACITSFNSDHSDIDCLIEELEYARQQPV